MKAAIAITGWFVLALPPVRQALEGGLILHMLVQIPALVVLGFVLGRALPAPCRRRVEAVDAYAINGLLIALLTGAAWLLPRSLDAAVADGSVAVAKFLTLPLLIGLPLALSWPRLHVVARHFVLAQAVSMLFVMGWLYMAAPTRLCNVYLESEQATAGALMLMGAVIMLLAMAASSLFGWERSPSHRPPISP